MSVYADLSPIVDEVRAKLDADILKGLPDEDREHIEVAIACGAFALCETPTQLESFAFDESSVAVIEKRLVDKYVGNVLKWDGLKIRRIKLDSGLHSSSEKQIKRFEALLNCYGLVFAYCVAKINNGKFELDDEGALVVKLENTGVLPNGKVWKFLKNGKEDSLLGFLAAIKRREVDQPHIQHIKDNMLETLKARGVVAPEGHRWQEWRDEVTGDLTKLVLLDAPSNEGGNEICAAYVNEGMFAQDFAAAPVEVLKAFAESEQGQEMLRNSYSEPDEFGQCVRADYLDEDGQLEAVRNYLRMMAGQVAPPGASLH